MKLIDDWRKVAKKAWSSRCMVIAFVLTAVEVILPFFNEDIPRGLFPSLSGLAVAGAWASRLIAQKDFNG